MFGYTNTAAHLWVADVGCILIATRGLVYGGAHMSFNTYTPPGWWDRTRLLRYAFALGLVFGVGIGWFFHNIISMIFQFGLVVLLLLPLATLAFMWWRSNRERNRMQSSTTVMRWGNGQFPPYGHDMAADHFGRLRFDRDEIIDADDASYQEPRR